MALLEAAGAGAPAAALQRVERERAVEQGADEVR
jgi:hypothetical protein